MLSSRRVCNIESPLVTLWIWLHRVSRLRARSGHSVTTRDVVDFSEHRISDDWFVRRRKGKRRSRGSRRQRCLLTGASEPLAWVVRMGPKPQGMIPIHGDPSQGLPLGRARAVTGGFVLARSVDDRSETSTFGSMSVAAMPRPHYDRCLPLTPSVQTRNGVTRGLPAFAPRVSFRG